MSLNDFNYNTDAFKMQKEASNHNGNEETQTTKKWQRNEFFAASAVEITKKECVEKLCHPTRVWSYQSITEMK